MATQAAVGRKTGPVSAEDRAEIIQLLETGHLSCGEIAARYGRATSTIARIAKAEGIDVDRSRTKAATAAKQADIQARLASLAEQLLDDAHRLREQLWKPCLVYSFGGKENDYNEHTIDQPDFRAKQAILTSVGIAVDKVVAIRKSEAGPGEATGLIVDLVNRIRGES